MRLHVSPAGVALLEMLLVIVFISVAFLSLLQLFVTNLAAEKDVEKTFLAMYLAGGKMENNLHLPFNAMLSENTSEVTGYSGFSEFVVVSSLEANLKEIKVVVSWGAQSASSQYVLTTVRSSYY